MKKSHAIIALSSMLLLEPIVEATALAFKKTAQE